MIASVLLSGHWGLTVDESLDRGRSDKCLTFDNEPLTPAKDFTVKALEAWAFMMDDD